MPHRNSFQIYMYVHEIISHLLVATYFLSLNTPRIIHMYLHWVNVLPCTCTQFCENSRTFTTALSSYRGNTCRKSQTKQRTVLCSFGMTRKIPWAESAVFTRKERKMLTNVLTWFYSRGYSSNDQLCCTITWAKQCQLLPSSKWPPSFRAMRITTAALL